MSRQKSSFPILESIRQTAHQPEPAVPLSPGEELLPGGYGVFESSASFPERSQGSCCLRPGQCFLGSTFRLEICSHSPPDLKDSGFAGRCCDGGNSSRAVAVSCL